MNEIINQVKRLFYDDGRNDKDFTHEELKYKEARNRLTEAFNGFIKAADDLYDELLNKK